MEHDDDPGDRPRHCHPETLTLCALGEPALDGRDAEHLLSCAACAADLARLRTTVRLARPPETGESAPSVAPPDRVWTAVAEQLGLSTAAPTPTSRTQSVAATRRARWRRRVPVAAALVAAAAASAIVTVAVLGTDDDDAGGPVVAAATLLALGTDSVTGSADWHDTPAGAVVHVELARGATAESAGYLEVWLLDPASGRVVPLGALPSDSAAAGALVRADLAVPSGIQPGDYPYIDVSVEPLDGDPAHSGLSLARGDLLAAD